MTEPAVLETPTATPEPIQPAPIETGASIEDHAAKFDPSRERESAVEETPAQVQQRRDRETGQFKPGKTRHRAKSQQATPEDVEKIGEYTRRIKTVEESIADITPHEGESPRAFELRRRAELIERIGNAKPEAVKAESGVPRPAQAQSVTQAWPDDPEPQDTDPKYESNYPQYLRDVAAWTGRQEFRTLRQQEQAQAAHQQRHAQFMERVAAAKADHPDFEAVAFTPVPWQSGSLVDRYIMEHGAGAKMLYYLQSHPAERDSIGQMTELQAHEFLSLLGQRLLSSPSSAAGTNGAAPRPEFKIASKPPTPLRTEAQRAAPAEPPTDGSLSIAEHARRFGPASRR